MINVGFINISQPQPITSEIDVTNFGAIGDGITDNTPAFENAWIVACSSTGNLKLSAGNFLVGPVTFSGPCKAKTMVVNVIGTVSAISMKDWNTKDDTWFKFENVENLIITGTGEFEGQGGSGWWNCDDCIAINGGSSNINVDGLFCGPGHGVREGREPVVHVSDVTFKDIHGTSSKSDAISIMCSKSSNSCAGITLNHVDIRPTNSSVKVESICHNTQVQMIGVVYPPPTCTPTSFISMALDYDDFDAVTNKQPSKDV
ncbi:hypothetical protein L6452_18831 [Arctium lappa]|nr:hypothetical protein L6452_18831 [Arctium lappa]